MVGLLLTGLSAGARPFDGAARATVPPRTEPAPSDAADTVGRALGERLRDPARPEQFSPHAWEHVRALYGDHPTARWVHDARGQARARALVEALGRAHEHGVRLSPALLTTVEAAAAALAEERTADALARADLLLTAAFAEYGQTMLTGQLSPRTVEAAWHIDPRAVDVDSALARSLRADDLGRSLEGLAPREDGYAVLRAALARYHGIVARGGWRDLRMGGVMRPGDTIPATVRLRERLAAEGFLALRDAGARHTDPRQYSGALVDAVARFQALHGLAVDSVLGVRTLGALNVSAGERLRQIAANLERYRWLPPHLGSRYVVVNVPAFRLDAFDGERHALSMRVVVGAELRGRRTPIFSDSMSYVQFGPYWNVPPGIARNEILPEALEDRSYLARNGYELLRGWGANAPIVDAASLDDGALMSGQYRVRQRPGPGNALGRVKFMFPNDYNVYLHDTPAQALFDDRVRAASHGCVRVADPAALAEFVLADRAAWTRSRIDSALTTGERVRVTLPEKIPVYLIYLTAFEEGGTLAFRPDRYQQDDALMRAIGDPPTGSHGARRLRALGAQLHGDGA